MTNHAAFQEFAAHFAEALSPMFEELLSNMEYHKITPRHMNRHLVADEWLEVRTLLIQIYESPYYNNKTVMEQLFGRIEIPQKHWLALKSGKTSLNTVNILEVIGAVAEQGNKATVSNLLSMYNGVDVLTKLFKRRSSSDEEKLLCLQILRVVVIKAKDIEMMEKLIPLFSFFMRVMKMKDTDTDIMVNGVSLIFHVSTCPNSMDLKQKLFGFKMIRFALDVFDCCIRMSDEYVSVKLFVWGDMISILNTVMMTEFELGSLSITRKELLQLAPHIVRALKTSPPNLEEYPELEERIEEIEENEIIVIRLAIDFISLLVKASNREHFNILIELDAVPAIAKAVQVLQNGHKMVDHFPDVISNTIFILSELAEHVLVFKPIASIIPIIEKIIKENSFCKLTVPQIASLYSVAATKGSKQDVGLMVNSGMVSLLATVYDSHTSTAVTKQIFLAFYHIILKVDSTKCFSQLHRHMEAMFTYWHVSNISPIVALHDSLNLLTEETAYVLAVVTDSCDYCNQGNTQQLNSYFEVLFEDKQSDPDKLKQFQPCQFLVQKMHKFKNLQAIVLKHIWYLTCLGSEEQISKLFSAIPCPKKLSTPSTEDQKVVVLKFVLTQTKIIIESKEKYNVSVLVQITDFLTKIPCNDQEDDVFKYHLEDLVSPCLGLLENQNNKVIIDNVKKYINNLHYS